MAVCTTGAEWASESGYVPRPFVQIVQAILRRAIRDFAQTPPISMGRATAAGIHPRVKQKRGSTRRAAQDAVFQKAFAGLCAEDRDWLSDQ